MPSDADEPHYPTNDAIRKMLTKFENRPFRLFTYVLAIVFSTEAMVMFVLPLIVPAGAHEVIAACLDATLLTTVLSPLLWVLIVGPLRKVAIMRQRIFAATLSGQEEERRRIARELHDGLGQVLTTLLVGLRTIEESSQDETVQDLARDLRRIGGEVHDDVRRLSRGLRPAVLDDSGLIPALERLLDDVRIAHPTSTHLKVEGADQPRLSADIETAIYRIVQEAVANSIRHGHAKEINVALRRNHDSVVLEIDDNGRGFDLNTTLNQNMRTVPFGIFSIGERARLLDGNAVIESTPDKGTRLKVYIPLRSGA